MADGVGSQSADATLAPSSNGKDAERHALREMFRMRLILFACLCGIVSALLTSRTSYAQGQGPLGLAGRDPRSMDLQSAEADVKRLKDAVVRYVDFTPQQKEKWRARVDVPYEAGAADAVPLEAETAEWLFGLLETDTLRSRGAFWEIGHDAFVILLEVAPGSPRLAAAGRRILEGPLPEELMPIPHENLLVGALVAVQSNGRDEDIEYLLQTEQADFWRGRLAGSRLSPDSSWFKDQPEEQRLLLMLRSRALFVLARNRPAEAVGVLEAVIARVGENAGYIEHAKYLLQQVRRKMEGQSEPPVHDPRPSRDPLVPPAEAPLPTAYELTPVLDYRLVNMLKPNLEWLAEKGWLSATALADCLVLADMQGQDYVARIAACRRLAPERELPFEVRRWAVLQHVLLAGSLNLPDEMEAVAWKWLEQYPRDWDHLPPYWKEKHADEINATVYLRGYLGHVYTHVWSETFAWPAEERVKKLRAVMEPIFVLEELQDRHAVAAGLYYLDALSSLTGDWARTRLQRAVTPPQREAAAREIREAEHALAREELLHLSEARQALEAAREGRNEGMPDRGGIRDPEAYLAMVDERLATVHDKMDAVEQARPQQTRAEEEEIDAAWQDLLQTDK